MEFKYAQANTHTHTHTQAMCVRGLCIVYPVFRPMCVCDMNLIVRCVVQHLVVVSCVMEDIHIDRRYWKQIAM
jgi:uncharacterized membrane protein